MSKKTLSQKEAFVIELLKAEVQRSARQLGLSPAGLLLLLSLGLSDLSDSLGETNLCGTAVTDRAFAALGPKFLMTSLKYSSL